MATAPKIEQPSNEVAPEANAPKEANASQTAMTQGSLIKLHPKIATIITEDSERRIEKAKAIGQIRQRLAEAADVANQAGGYVAEARTIASEQGAKLYQMQAQGLLTKAEVSATLGDTFGYKVSATTGKQSKTPDGLGEDIRKRIVRAADASSYVAGEESKYFANVPKSVLTPILSRLEEGSLSLWTAYGDLPEARKDYQPDTNSALDPAKVLKFVESISFPDVVSAIRESEACVVAYNALLEAVLTIMSPDA